MNAMTEHETEDNFSSFGESYNKALKILEMDMLRIQEKWYNKIMLDVSTSPSVVIKSEELREWSNPIGRDKWAWNIIQDQKKQIGENMGCKKKGGKGRKK